MREVGAGWGYALVGSGRVGWAAALTSPCAAFSSAAPWDAMEQALASPGLFSDDDGAAAASPVLESTATGFGADVRKDLLSEFSAISPNLEGSQQVRLEPWWRAPSSAVSCMRHKMVALHGQQGLLRRVCFGRSSSRYQQPSDEGHNKWVPLNVVLSSGAGFGVTALGSCSGSLHKPKMCWCTWKCMKRCSGVLGNLGSTEVLVNY